MEDERTGSDSQTEPDEEPPQRDLGLGHPLSPEDDTDPESADDRSGSTDADPDPVEEGYEPNREERERVSAEGNGEPGVSRRGLLVGGVGGAVAASLGWVGVLTVGGGNGPDGAEGVGVDYLNAIADNDWAAAGAMFHNGSEFGQGDRSYEAFLQNRSQQQFEAYSSIEPSVEGHYTLTHITDPEQAVQSDVGFIGVSAIEELDLNEIEESKQIVIMASVRPENLNRTETQREYLGDQSTVPFSFTTVRDDAGWQIVRAFGGGVV